LIDRTVGLFHFLADRVPANLPEVPPQPRKTNPWLQEGKPVVAKTKAEQDIRQTVAQAIAVLGPLSKSSRGNPGSGEANFNSDDAPPATTDLTFLRAIVEILLESGAHVTIGKAREASGDLRLRFSGISVSTNWLNIWG